MRGKDFGGIAARVASQRENCYRVARRWRAAIAAVDAFHDKCQRAPFSVDRELDMASAARVAQLNAYHALLALLVRCPSPLDGVESAERVLACDEWRQARYQELRREYRGFDSFGM